jgi:hypothetical protein
VAYIVVVTQCPDLGTFEKQMMPKAKATWEKYGVSLVASASGDKLQTLHGKGANRVSVLNCPDEHVKAFAHEIHRFVEESGDLVEHITAYKL